MVTDAVDAVRAGAVLEPLDWRPEDNYGSCNSLTERIPTSPLMDHSYDDLTYGYSMTNDESSDSYSSIKRFVYQTSRWAGLFRVASRKTEQFLRILCYHGFSTDDESRFRPRLFIRPLTFQNRIEYLRRNSFSILTLDQALQHLATATVPPRAVVITVDDGFFSFYEHGVPILRKFSCPATVYVATADFVRSQPIFRLVVQYMFWKSKAELPRLEGLCDASELPVQLTAPEARRQAMWKIVQFGDSLNTDAERADLACELGRRLGIDYGDIVRRRGFCVMRPEELSNLAAYNIDVQLHTHNHRFPEAANLAEREILKNREILSPLLKKPLVHFCYPSGIWSRKHWPVLAATGIQSAMTCEPGLNDSQTTKYELRRFLDGEDIGQVEFDAEMCGYSELMRRVSSRFRHRFSSS